MNVRMVVKPLMLSALLLGGCASMPADVVRYKFPGSDFPIAQAVVVPAGAKTYYLSGTGPSITDKTVRPDSIAAYGDTKAQSLNTLLAIEATLKSMKLEMKDVVKMTVFLAGDPALDGKIDFAGFMDSYKKFFGGPEHPNLPARSTVKVAALVNPGWLIEVEVVAVAPN